MKDELQVAPKLEVEMRACMMAIVATLSSITFLGCAKNSPKFENVGPRITGGLYIADKPADKNLPAVSIQIADGNTYAYSFLQYECESQVTAQFEKSGTTFSDDAGSAGGPNVSVLGKNCDVQTEILADSPSTLLVKIKLNNKDQKPYVLTKVGRDEFLSTVKALADKAQNFSVEEEACASLGMTCVQAELSNK